MVRAVSIQTTNTANKTCHLGAPTDDPEPAIIQAAKRLDARLFPLSQVGIQFVQIGQDEDAAEFLRELDDNLSSVHGIRVRSTLGLLNSI